MSGRPIGTSLDGSMPSRAELAKLRAVFDKIDIDNSGSLEKPELMLGK